MNENDKISVSSTPSLESISSSSSAFIINGMADGDMKKGPPKGSHVPAANPLDINNTNFNPDLFIKKIIKEYSLNKLMETESNLIRQIQDLDSDMQTLVYENYNKFILATDTIRKMKTDFGKMEDKMGLLSSNISLIAENSASVSNSLKDKRDKVSKLSAIHDLLKKLKFLFELPNKLKHYCEEKNYEEAVAFYLNGVEFVTEFKMFPSLEAIKFDCQEIIKSIKDDLYNDFEDSEKSSQDLTRNVTLLLSLGEPPSNLGHRFLDNALPKLQQNLESVNLAVSPNVPLEEFMELGCGIFVSNLSLVIASFSQVFIQTSELEEGVRLEAQDALKVFSQTLIRDFMDLVAKRLLPEIQSLHSHEYDSDQREELIKALERLYRRLISLGILVPNADFAPMGLDLIQKVTKQDASLSLERIKKSFEKAVKESSTELVSHPGSSQEILGSILATLVLQMKSSLEKLQDFCKPDLQFAQNSHFRQEMSISCVREGLVVASFQYLAEFGKNIVYEGQYDNLTWLLLAKLYLDIEIGTVEYMLNSVETEFEIKRDKKTQSKWKLTNVADITAELNSTAKLLVKEFVNYRGNQVAECLNNAILEKNLMLLDRDPAAPQEEVKQVVDMLSKLEKIVDSIFPDPDSSSYMLSERSSDSSKRSYSTPQSASAKGPSRQSMWSNMDPNITTNIQKLFSEKVEIFGRIELQKSDIIMAIVKIGLRALLEFVRQKTLSKFGLHQIQVDVHYFQLYLWRFVNNEGYLYSLLDEILASSIHRCVNPTLLEASLVESLAEK